MHSQHAFAFAACAALRCARLWQSRRAAPPLCAAAGRQAAAQDGGDPPRAAGRAVARGVHRACGLRARRRGPGAAGARPMRCARRAAPLHRWSGRGCRPAYELAHAAPDPAPDAALPTRGNLERLRLWLRLSCFGTVVDRVFFRSVGSDQPRSNFFGADHSRPDPAQSNRPTTAPTVPKLTTIPKDTDGTDTENPDRTEDTDGIDGSEGTDGSLGRRCLCRWRRPADVAGGRRWPAVYVRLGAGVPGPPAPGAPRCAPLALSLCFLCAFFVLSLCWSAWSACARRASLRDGVRRRMGRAARMRAI